MEENMIRKSGLAATLVAGALAVSSCDQPSSTGLADLHGQHAATAMSATGTQNAGLVAAVRAATARYHSTVVAAKAGYAEDPFCVEAAGVGGMGHHWVNHSLVDPVFDPTKPEVVLYAPDKNGRMQLVAVEYIVIDAGQAAPTFDGHPFDVGGTPVPVAHWSLHVWLYEPNSLGLNAPFNPAVDCP
jgi:hypothetical protein